MLSEISMFKQTQHKNRAIYGKLSEDEYAEDEYAFYCWDLAFIVGDLVHCYSCSCSNFQPRWKPKIVRETLKCSIK